MAMDCRPFSRAVDSKERHRIAKSNGYVYSKKQVEPVEQVQAVCSMVLFNFHFSDKTTKAAIGTGRLRLFDRNIDSAQHHSRQIPDD